MATRSSGIDTDWVSYRISAVSHADVPATAPAATTAIAATTAPVRLRWRATLRAASRAVPRSDVASGPRALTRIGDIAQVPRITATEPTMPVRTNRLIPPLVESES